MKINEVKQLQKANDESNIELGRVKGMLAREKERSEDSITDLELAEFKLKVRAKFIIKFIRNKMRC